MNFFKKDNRIQTSFVHTLTNVVLEWLSNFPGPFFWRWYPSGTPSLSHFRIVFRSLPSLSNLLNAHAFLSHFMNHVILPIGSLDFSPFWERLSPTCGEFSTGYVILGIYHRFLHP